MSSVGVPSPDPNQQYQPWLPAAPNPSNGIYGYSALPYGAWDPNANNGQGNGPDTSQLGFAPSGNEADVDPNASMEKIYAANRDTINTTGNAIGQQAGNALNYYGGVQQNYQTAQNNALNQLQQTPGFNPGEAGQINVDYSQYNTTPGQYSAIAGDPNAPVQTLNNGVNTENTSTQQYGQNLGAQLGQAEQWSKGAADQFATGVGGAASGLGSGLQSAQSKFAPLDTAVNNPALGFDPNGTEKQLTDSDVNDLVTSAGTTVGNQFGTAEDTLRRQAAAQGNTSPAAEAALRQQLVTQEAATAGDTMTNARIAALQAQYGRAQGIEGQREAATQAQTGFQATAATTEEAAAQAAAAQAGQANIGAQEAIGSNSQNVANNAGQQNINAANTYGQFNVGQQNTQTGQQYGAQSTAEQLGAQRAQTSAQMQNQQGVTAAQDTSQGAQTVGNARIAGQGNYRTGVQGQQQLAQSGAQGAQQTQLGAYGTQTSGANTAASGQAGFEVNKPSFGDSLAKDTAGSIANLFENGGMADEDMIAKVGERGPEMVVPASGDVNATMLEGVRGGRYGGPKNRRKEEIQFGVAA